MRQTENAKVAPVQREHYFDSFAICKMHQRGIRKLYSQSVILGENPGNERNIGLAQRNKPKRAAMERGQEFPDRLRVCAQQPCRLGNHRPASPERASDVTKLLDTRFVVFVRFQQDRSEERRVGKEGTSR